MRTFLGYTLITLSLFLLSLLIYFYQIITCCFISMDELVYKPKRKLESMSYEEIVYAQGIVETGIMITTLMIVGLTTVYIWLRNKKKIVIVMGIILFPLIFYGINEIYKL